MKMKVNRFSLRYCTLTKTKTPHYRGEPVLYNMQGLIKEPIRAL